MFHPPPVPAKTSSLKVTVFGAVILLPVVVALKMKVEEAALNVEVVAITNRPARV
jgi:hypothetical protein